MDRVRVSYTSTNQDLGARLLNYPMYIEINNYCEDGCNTNRSCRDKCSSSRCRDKCRDKCSSSRCRDKCRDVVVPLRTINYQHQYNPLPVLRQRECTSCNTSYRRRVADNYFY